MLTTQQTLHNAVSAHISSDYSKTEFRIQHSSNITNIRMQASDIAFITNILQMCCRHKWNSNIFFISTYFSLKEAKKEPKGRTKLLRPANLRLGQKSQKTTKLFQAKQLEKGQSGNPGSMYSQLAAHSGSFSTYQKFWGCACTLCTPPPTPLCQSNML